MTATGIRFSRKETRQLAEEAEAAGFVYVGDDTKGHAEFAHPTGIRLSLSETPAHGQIKRIRDIIARATGTRRGSFDRQAQRDRQATANAARRQREADLEAAQTEWLNRPLPTDDRNLVAAAVAVVKRHRRNGQPQPAGADLIRLAERELERARAHGDQH